MKFFLTGPHEGKTISFREYHFVNGCMEVPGDPDRNASLAIYLNRCWQVVPEWKYKEMLDVRAREKVQEAVRGDVRPAGGEPASLSEVHGGGDGGHQGRDSGVGAVGIGHEDAGIRQENPPRPARQADDKRRKVAING